MVRSPFPIAAMAVSGADLILAIGCRFDDRVTGRTSEFGKKAKIVHIDIDPTSIQKNVPVSIPVVADCRSFLTALRQALEPGLDDPAMLSLAVASLYACFARHTYYVELTNGQYFYVDPPLVLDAEKGVYYMT